MENKPESQHSKEIQENLEFWKNKPLLQKIYADFYRLITGYVDFSLNGKIVELGSGIGNLKSAIPDAISTDLFPNPWIDQVENAYKLTFPDNSISNLILFDVFHHFQYPGSALNEFKRVLTANGRVIIFEPYISLLGYLVYGIFHHEPINGNIDWTAPENADFGKLNYYAAQGNAKKVFYGRKYHENLTNWEILIKKRISSISYIASGGYSKPQLYPDKLYPFFKRMDELLYFFPWVFGTRAIIVLKKKN